MANELVALHTQALAPTVADPYLDLLQRSLRAARLNNAYPDRRRLQNTLKAMTSPFHGGLYDAVYVDARSGLPNMAAVTRVTTDREVALQGLDHLRSEEELERRRGEAEVFERLHRKRGYYEQLQKLSLAPVDEHRVALRRHDPDKGMASFRLDLTKLDPSGLFIRVGIELTQTASVWRRKVIDLDEEGETADSSEAFHSLVYRYAGFDAETLFIHMHEIEGVSVERVTRGVVGPALFAVPQAAGGDIIRPVGVPEGPLRKVWEAWLGDRMAAGAIEKPELLVCFQHDVAALDVREEKSNDPLGPLLKTRIRDNERARYIATRERYPFRVYKDAKFVATKGAKKAVELLCKAAETKNLIYELR